MPVCVAGMHRSGTSLVARLLAASGLDGGPPSELVVPAPDNPEGFGENLRFLRLNDEILARFGGTWDRPPVLRPGWTGDRRLASLRREAAALVGRFGSDRPWFWKDPRNSLTLPFWREMMPDLRVVLCLRDPREVMASLWRRRQAVGPAGWALWLTYNSHALASVPRDHLVVTHHEAYLHDAAAELERVVEALGLTVDARRLAHAVATVSPRRRVHGGAPAGAEAAMPAEVGALYRVLCAGAGPVWARARDAEARAGSRASAPPSGSRPSPARRGLLIWGMHAVRRVWRQEGARALARVMTLRIRSQLRLARRHLGRRAPRSSPPLAIARGDGTEPTGARPRAS
jgi:hypothetical protein